MLANADLPQEFTTLATQYRKLVQALLEAVGIPPVSISVAPTSEGNFRGFDGDQFYVVTAGSLSARHHGRTVYILEQGDILLPDIAGTTDVAAVMHYGSDDGATLDAYPALEFMRRVFASPDAVRAWTRLLITYAGLMTRISAAMSDSQHIEAADYDQFQAGQDIIRQGEEPGDVFHLSTGRADVLVDDVSVGVVEAGEIFGAMSALTQSPRSATVRALEPCAVMKVPQERFAALIRSNPATIQSLMADMANSIINLNEQLVGKRTTRTVE